MVFEWNESRVTKLISIVKKHSALFDESSEDYSNKELKSQLWETVAKQMGTNARDCRRKWTGMCLKYFQWKEASSGNGEDWPWRDRISFIDPNAVQNGDDRNVKASAIVSPSDEVRSSGSVDEKSASIDGEGEVTTGALGEVKDMLSSLVSALSVSKGNLPTRESSSVDTSKGVVSTSTKNSVEGTSAGLEEDDETKANVKANRLFLESLVDDMSSLSMREQYDFKVEVLVLLRSYLLRHKN